MKTTTDELRTNVFSWVSEDKQSMVYAILASVLVSTTIPILLFINGYFTSSLVPLVILMTAWMLSFSMLVEAAIKSVASRLVIVE